MDGGVEDVRVLIEDLFGPVSVVDVEVDDRDAVVLPTQVKGRDCDIIE